MEIKDEIIIKQNEIDKINKELIELEKQINEAKNDIIPTLVVNIKESLKEKAFNYYVTSNYEISASNVKILKDELYNTIEEIGNNLVEELNNSKLWNFDQGKVNKDLDIYQDEKDLSKNKKLWETIRKSPEKIDNLFKKYNFPVDHRNYSYTGEYHSPYGINLYRMDSIFGYGFEKDDTSEIINSMKIYWENIDGYIKKIKFLENLKEELRKLKRRETWGN